MKSQTIIFLCTSAQITRERAGYYQALKDLGYEVVLSGDVDRIRPLIDNLSGRTKVIGIIQVEASALLPLDLWDIPIPNICFQIDTNSDTKRRARSAKAFDAAIVFHPGYVEKFQQLGVPQAFFLPHAIQKKMFNPEDEDKLYDIGWVGRFDGNNYKYRRQLVKGLQSRYKINDINRYYTQDEMAKIYKQSKIIVNIGKDNYLQDANLRCFEAMASGALLLTPHPTEITEIGFKDGEHFVSFTSEKDLIDKVDYYLLHDLERMHISNSGFEEVIQNHTYHARAKQLLEILIQLQPNGSARQWSLSKRLREIVFFKIRWGKIEEAFDYLSKINNTSLHFYQALFFIAKRFVSKVKNAF